MGVRIWARLHSWRDPDIYLLCVRVCINNINPAATTVCVCVCVHTCSDHGHSFRRFFSEVYEWNESLLDCEIHHDGEADDREL